MTDHRHQPRRRGAELEHAILQAALDELSELGFRAMTMDSVAKRAHASKASVYRRWPTKALLAMDAVRSTESKITFPEEPSTLRDDLVTWLSAVSARAQSPFGQAIIGAMLESADKTDFTQFSQTSTEIAETVFAQILDRARHRGDAVPENLSDIQIHTPVALLHHRFLTNNSIDDAFIAGVIDDVILPMLGMNTPEYIHS